MSNPGEEIVPHHRAAGAGPPLLCLHGGMGMDHHLFLPWLEELAHRARVVFFDFSGNGRSPAPEPTQGSEEPGELLGHELWLRDVEALRAHLGLERMVLLGHSHGGFLAQEYALRHPERVSRLVLSNTAPVLDFAEAVLSAAAPHTDDEEGERALALLGGPAPDSETLEAGFRVLLPLYFHRWDPAQGERLLQGVRFRARAYNAGQRDLARFDTRDRLPELPTPTLVLSGGHDWIMPEEHGGRRLAELIPDATHRVFEESGHFPYVEEPERFLHAVGRFMEGVGG